jgi:hypothetical protein
MVRNLIRSHSKKPIHMTERMRPAAMIHEGHKSTSLALATIRASEMVLVAGAPSSPIGGTRDWGSCLYNYLVHMIVVGCPRQGVLALQLPSREAQQSVPKKRVERSTRFGRAFGRKMII